MATTTKKKTTTTEDMLAGMITDYQGRSAYTPKTAAEIQAQAQGEYQPYYDQQRLAARQQQQQADLALQQQRAGLQNTYDRQREASVKDYRQRYSQADRQMLSRGMQRSSYGAQVLANINQQGAEAQQRLWDAQGTAEGNIDAQRAQLQNQLAAQMRQYDSSQAADVLNRTRQLQDQEYERAQAQQQWYDQLGFQLASALRLAERDQISDEQFERQFGLNKQQAEAQLANMQWQQARTEARDRAADEQWARQQAIAERQLEAQLANQAWQQARQEARDKVSDEQFERQFGMTKAQFEAQLAQQQWQRDYQTSRDQVADEQWQKNYDFNERKLAESLDQWQKEYDLKAFQAGYNGAGAGSYGGAYSSGTLGQDLTSSGVFKYGEDGSLMTLSGKPVHIIGADSTGTTGSGNGSGSSYSGGGSNYSYSYTSNNNTKTTQSTPTSTPAKKTTPTTTAELISELSKPAAAPAASGQSILVNQLSQPSASKVNVKTQPAQVIEVAGPVNPAFLAGLNKLGASENKVFESQLANALKNKKK